MLEVRCFYISCFSLGPHNIDLFFISFYYSHLWYNSLPPHYPLHCHCKGKRTEKKVMTKPQGFNLKFIPLRLFEAAWSMNSLLLFKKETPQLPKWVSSCRGTVGLSITCQHTTCPCLQQELDSCSIFCHRVHGFEEITIKTWKTWDFKTAVPLSNKSVQEEPVKVQILKLGF